MTHGSALPNPETRAMEAGEQAYPGEPERGAVYAEGYLQGWIDAVKLDDEEYPEGAALGSKEGGDHVA